MFVGGKKQKNKLQNHRQLINAKSKRKRNLVKKAIELSQMCEVEVLLLVKDNSYNRVTIYESGATQADRFTVDKAFQHIKNIENMEVSGW